MSVKVFIATTGSNLARAELGVEGHWFVESLLAGQDVRCIAADPHHPDVAYAGTQANGILRSEDRGRTWRHSGLDGHSVKSIAVSPAVPGLIFAGTKPPMLFVSRDHGRHWAELEAFRAMRRWWWLQPAEYPLTTYLQAIAPSPTDPDVLLVGIEACGVFRTSDGGRTWSGHLRGSVRDCHSLTFHATNGDWAYEAGGTGAGAAYSCDGGLTWSQPRDGLDRHYGFACAADPAHPEIWYASLSPLGKYPWNPPRAHVHGQATAFIFRRMGDGAWQKLGGSLPQPLDFMAYALFTDPAAPGHLYAGLSNGDIWHTADLGVAWRQLPLNLGAIHHSLIMI